MLDPNDRQAASALWYMVVGLVHRSPVIYRPGGRSIAKTAVAQLKILVNHAYKFKVTRVSL